MSHCTTCQHFNKNIFQESDGKSKSCKAFLRIPNAIWSGKVNHTKRLTGQVTNYVYEKKVTT